MMRKGFTLVEMAIVLVIIGILLTFAASGRTLIDSARVRRDISIVHNINIQFNSFLNDNFGELPAGFTLNSLITGGYLTADDLKLNDGAYTLKLQTVIRELEAYKPSATGSTLVLFLPKAGYVTGCKLDATMDDGTSSYGTMRVIDGTGSYEVVDVKSCKAKDERYAILLYN